MYPVYLSGFAVIKRALGPLFHGGRTESGDQESKMTHEAEQDRMAAHRREWDKQSIYLRLLLGDPPGSVACSPDGWCPSA